MSRCDNRLATGELSPAGLEYLDQDTVSNSLLKWIRSDDVSQEIVMLLLAHAASPPFCQSGLPSSGVIGTPSQEFAGQGRAGKAAAKAKNQWECRQPQERSEKSACILALITKILGRS